MSNLLENIVYGMPKDWADKAYEANTTGMSDGYCGSIEVIAEYIEHLESMVKAKEGYALVPVDLVKRLVFAHYASSVDWGAMRELEEISAATETNVACDLCKGSGKKVVGPDQDGRKYKVDCDCAKP